MSLKFLMYIKREVPSDLMTLLDGPDTSRGLSAIRDLGVNLGV